MIRKAWGEQVGADKAPRGMRRFVATASASSKTDDVVQQGRVHGGFYDLPEFMGDNRLNRVSTIRKL